MNYAKLLEISSFFTWHIFLEIGKTQDMPSKIWQTLGDALSVMELYMSLFQLVLLYPSSNMNYICPFSNLNYIAVELLSNLNYIVVALFCAIFSKLKSSLFKHLFPTIQKIIYAFALIQQWLMLQMQ